MNYTRSSAKYNQTLRLRRIPAPAMNPTTPPDDAPDRPRRQLRSFVRRAGRLTAGQARALDRLGPRYLLDPGAATLDLDAAFGRHAPRVLEIGFGSGEALLALAGRCPWADFVGVEVHEPGIGHLLMELERAGLDNVRAICRDVVEVLAALAPDTAFDAVNVFFPDPWPKKRHHKRRLIQPPFIARLAGVQPPGALLHFATDWQPYAQHVAEVVDADARYARIEPEQAERDPLAWRPETRFERRGLRRGHEVSDLYWRRTDVPAAG